jgi:hypothetical protein
MKRVNLLLTLLSLNALLVTIERFSFTTKIILQPYSFLRLHELIQMTLIILISAIIPFFILKEVTHNFESLKSTKGTLLGALFITGLYFYATGNGLHEVASYLFNTFCDTKKITTVACGSMYFNDYYTGNIMYFAGLFFSNISLIIFEIMAPAKKKFNKNDMIVTFINSLVLGLMFFAYAAFDTVLVGLFYICISTIAFVPILFIYRKKYTSLPFTTYTALAYLISTIPTVIVRFF